MFERPVVAFWSSEIEINLKMRAYPNPARTVASISHPPARIRPRSPFPVHGIASPPNLAYNLTLTPPPFDTIVHYQMKIKLHYKVCYGNGDYNNVFKVSGFYPAAFLQPFLISTQVL